MLTPSVLHEKLNYLYLFGKTVLESLEPASSSKYSIQRHPDFGETYDLDFHKADFSLGSPHYSINVKVMAMLNKSSSRDHLLTSNTPAPSIYSARPSRPSSIFSDTSIDTLVAGSPQQPPTGYRGFPSKEAYLEALREWVDDKTYYEADVQLKGWYGTKTKQDYLDKTSIWEERRERKQAEKAEKMRVERERRKTVAMPRLPEEGEVNEARVEEGREDGGEVRDRKERRGSKLRGLFGRRATVA